MNIRPIRTDTDHAKALAEIERLWGAPEGSDEGDRLDVLVTLVDAYEARRWPLPPADPVETIKAAMEMNSYSQADLAAVLGSAPRASEILTRKRALTLPMIWKINAAWRIPADLLVQPYELAA